MTDAAFVYRQTNQERKRISYGAKNKKRRSKTRFVKTPTDFLSRKEKKELNGGVEVYQLGSPMNYETFKGMPFDLQSQYIRSCINLGARKIDICEMLGVRVDTFDSYMSINHKGEFRFVRGKKEPDMRWLEWVTSPDGGVVSEKKETAFPKNTNELFENAEEKKVSVEKEESERKTWQNALPASGTLTFEGKAENIFTAAMQLLGMNESYSITITFTKNA